MSEEWWVYVTEFEVYLTTLPVHLMITAVVAWWVVWDVAGQAVAGAMMSSTSGSAV